LNVKPEAFWAGLADQFLFAKLHQIFYVSLMTENQRRVEHMTGAVKHIEDKTEVLARKSRALRLEAITEEIEVILLGAGFDVDRDRPGGVHS
jgi:F-type H+-transporting ATPase subunit gamma